MHAHVRSIHRQIPVVDRDRQRTQLRRDRIVGTLAIGAVIAIMAILVWLASFGAGSVPPNIDYWMMP